jgi:hypothetical protein
MLFTQLRDKSKLQRIMNNKRLIYDNGSEQI